MAAQGCEFYLRVLKVSLTSERFFFFNSFIGCSSCYIQYKFTIQHTHTHTQKKKKRKKKEKRSKNPKGGGAKGLTSHARHRPYIKTYVQIK